jgi:predicted site-specific integrase-resolvase
MPLNQDSTFLTSKKTIEILGVSIVTLRKWAKDGLIDTIRTSGKHRLYDVKSFLRELNIEKEKNTLKKDIAKENDDIEKEKNTLKKDSVKQNEDTEKKYILNKIKKHTCKKINKEINDLSDNDNDIDIDTEDTMDGSTNQQITINNKQKQNICYIRISFPNQNNVLEKYREYMNKHYSKNTIIEDIGSGIDFDRKGFRKIMKLALEKKIDSLVIINKDNLTSIGYEFIEYIIKNNSNGKIINENLVETNTKESTMDNIINLIDLYNKKYKCDG